MILLPVLVVRHGTVIHAVLSSKKSAEKTLETGMLWEVHPSTYRVIPAQFNIAIERVCCAASWYVAYAAKDAEFSKSELVLEEENTPAYDNECKVLVAENTLNGALSNGQAEKRATYADSKHA